MKRALLASGIIASLIYVAANLISPMYFPGYDWMSQTVSELSAIGAPSRVIWLAFIFPFGVFVTLFGLGVWAEADGKRSLRIVGGALVVHGVVGLSWPPMHLRGSEFTLTDALHIAFTAVTVPLMVIQMSFGAVAFGLGFRVYTVLSIVVLLGFGIITGVQSPNIASNLPTPYIGVWERMSIAAYMLWLAVFAISLLVNERRSKGVRELSRKRHAPQRHAS